MSCLSTYIIGKVFIRYLCIVYKRTPIFIYKKYNDFTSTYGFNNNNNNLYYCCKNNIINAIICFTRIERNFIYGKQKLVVTLILITFLNRIFSTEYLSQCCDQQQKSTSKSLNSTESARRRRRNYSIEI